MWLTKRRGIRSVNANTSYMILRCKQDGSLVDMCGSALALELSLIRNTCKVKL